MLDQLVESKSSSENTARRGGYLLTTSVLVFSLFASGIMWSLFARDLDMGSDSLELSSMVAPVPMPEEVPPTVEPERPAKQEPSAKTESNVPTRQVNMARVDEPFVPKDISTTQNNVKSRPNNSFNIGKEDIDPKGGSPNVVREGNGNIDSRINSNIKSREIEKIDEEPPPVIAKKPEPKVDKPKNITVSKGVINGTASFLPKPTYPPAAVAIRASGDVSVQVTIDERGNVISANAVSGHPLLRQVSESAARNAKFKPTLLSDQPVKVTGIIVYKFAPR